MKEIPPGISAVDCDDTEASLLDCTSTATSGIQGECSVARSSANDATVLACGTADASGAHPIVHIAMIASQSPPHSMLSRICIFERSASLNSLVCDAGLVQSMLVAVGFCATPPGCDDGFVRVSHMPVLFRDLHGARPCTGSYIS